jgi:preprotein translocase subunit SecD
MKKALAAAVLVVLCAAGCKTHTHNVNNASQKLCIDSKAIVTEKNIRDAQATRDSATGEPEVMLYLDRSGGDRMYEATQRISARRDNGRMAIFIDGNFLTAPVVRNAIKDSMVIAGGFTERSAQDLADALMAGK